MRLSGRFLQSWPGVREQQWKKSCAQLVFCKEEIVGTKLSLFPSSHCITGSGFPGQFAEGEDDDSLSPEACYECKINGGGKNGRHKRNADENEIDQVHGVANRFSVLVLASGSELGPFGFPDSTK